MDIEAVVQKIRQSSKYRDADICEETIRDLLEAELGQHKSTNAAIKAAKKKLHRVVAPYLGDPDYEAALESLQAAFASQAQDAIAATCQELMATHASTGERLRILDQFYARIFQVTGKPESILDIACGLHPLAFPWMELPLSTRYYAYDIHRTRVRFLNQYFDLQGLAPLAKDRDVLVQAPAEAADLALILKEIPRFESRQKRCTVPLLAALQVRYLVLSVATQNLTGRWDLKTRNRELIYSLIEGYPWSVTEIEFDTELVFCIDKTTPHE